jgi:hypothetical protein
MDLCIGVGSGFCEAAVGIRKLECMQMQVVERLAVIADRRSQEPAPERAQVLPSRAQVLVALIGYAPHVAQAELRNDAGDPLRHREQRTGEPGVLSGSVAGNEERIPRQFNSRPAPKQAHRAGRPAVPRGVAVRALPPGRVPELEVPEQKRTLTCPPACGAVQTRPEILVHPHYLGQRMPVAFSRSIRHLFYKQFIELVNELKAGVDGPVRDRHRERRVKRRPSPVSSHHLAARSKLRTVIFCYRAAILAEQFRARYQLKTA